MPAAREFTAGALAQLPLRASQDTKKSRVDLHDASVIP